jgi:hypothetical protein
MDVDVVDVDSRQGLKAPPQVGDAEFPSAPVDPRQTSATKSPHVSQRGNEDYQPHPPPHVALEFLGGDF